VGIKFSLGLKKFSSVGHSYVPILLMWLCTIIAQSLYLLILEYLRWTRGKVDSARQHWLAARFTQENLR
jgi:hypothetical protein